MLTIVTECVGCIALKIGSFVGLPESQQLAISDGQAFHNKTLELVNATSAMDATLETDFQPTNGA